MSTVLQLSVPDGSPAAQKVVDALTALGATVTTSDGLLRSTVPTGACAVCGEVYALSHLADVPVLGGPACEDCRGVARRLYDGFWAAATRQWQEYRRQLPRVIHDIRQGADDPVFYRGFE